MKLEGGRELVEGTKEGTFRKPIYTRQNPKGTDTAAKKMLSLKGKKKSKL